ncbi:MAG TPA: hypothetical protein VGQ83_03970 [Polyangia bacterium]
MARRRPPRALLLGLLAGGLALGCAAGPARPPLAPPLWHDPDRQPVARKPAARFAGVVADALDHTVLEPLANVLLPAPAGEARNVNALDEVPDSSWFQNRIGLFPRSPEETARGACTDPPLDGTAGPWRISSAKTEGITPGFFLRTPDGRRYLLKVDDSTHPERGTAADAIASRIYHAAGYHAPCNEVVLFDPRRLEIAPGAHAEDGRGRRRPFTARDLALVISRAVRHPDGRVRMIASRLLPGEPLGPHALEGVRPDDPNDVVPHEHRRELRGLRLLAAWLDHSDVREANSLDTWVEEAGHHYVRHYQLDFGDAFGAQFSSDALARRTGHAYFLDVGQIAVDFLTLGLYPRPWNRVRTSPGAEIFGYFGWREFVASAWRPIYPHPAFERMTARDALWMVRILVRFSDDHIRALVRTGRLTSPAAEDFLVTALRERRDRIAREYLTRFVPLGRVWLTPAGARQRLCFEDLAIRAAGVAPERVTYRLRLLAGPRQDRELARWQGAPDPAQPDVRCVPLPWDHARPADLVSASARADDPRRFAQMHIAVQQGAATRPLVLVAGLYDLGPGRGFVLVSLDRSPRAGR